MNFTPNLVTGIVLVLFGSVLTLDRLGIVQAGTAFRYWPVLLIVFGLSVAWQAWRGDANGGMNGGTNGHRQRPIITPGLVFLMVIGWLLVSSASERNRSGSTESTSDHVTLVSVMGKSVRDHNRVFGGADLASVMGSAGLDLRNATIEPGQSAVVDVFGLMGEVDVMVPEGWRVDVRTVPIMGAVRDSRWGRARNGVSGRDATRDDPAPDQPPTTPSADADLERATPGPSTNTAAATGAQPTLVIRGVVMMGALRIRS